jgi:hypothetical protein
MWTLQLELCAEIVGTLVPGGDVSVVAAGPRWLVIGIIGA